MGKSKGGCLGLLSCVSSGDPAADDGTDDDSDIKAKREKRRRNFWTRSPRSQSPNNSTASEGVGVEKEISNVTVIKFSVPKASSEPENADEQEQAEEESAPQEHLDLSMEHTRCRPSVGEDYDEQSVIVIQTYIRRYLARREMRRVKSAIAIQAAARRFLVRKQAVGTLRCVLAITRMQGLVRARQARRPAEEFREEDYMIEEDPNTDQEKPHSMSEKLFQNQFARRIMETTPGTKINIKCDPSKSDSSWKWLARWMAAASSSDVETLLQKSVRVDSDPEADEAAGLTDVVESEKLPSPVAAMLHLSAVERNGIPEHSVVDSAADAASDESGIYSKRMCVADLASSVPLLAEENAVSENISIRTKLAGVDSAMVDTSSSTINELSLSESEVRELPVESVAFHGTDSDSRIDDPHDESAEGIAMLHDDASPATKEVGESGGASATSQPTKNRSPSLLKRPTAPKPGPPPVKTPAANLTAGDLSASAKRIRKANVIATKEPKNQARKNSSAVTEPDHVEHDHPEIIRRENSRPADSRPGHATQPVRSKVYSSADVRHERAKSSLAAARGKPSARAQNSASEAHKEAKVETSRASSAEKRWKI